MPSSDRDEQFCRDLTTRLGVPFVTDGADVTKRRGCRGHVVRGLRAPSALRLPAPRARRTLGADRIAVGHTRDDQAETFLLKLARGAGATGLGGVYPRRGDVIRPLLDVSRDDIQRWLREHGPVVGGGRDQRRSAQSAEPRSVTASCPSWTTPTAGPTRAQLARAAELAREDGQWLDAQAAARLEALAS